MAPDKLNLPETPKQNKDSKQKEQKPFDPIEQRLDGNVNLINIEYKEKFGKDLSDKIKNLLKEALNGKNVDERDKIFDILTDTIKYGEEDTIDADITEYLESINLTQTKNTNEENKTNRNEKNTEIKQTENKNEQIKIDRNAELESRGIQFDELSKSLSTLDGEGKDDNYKGILKSVTDLKTLVNKNGFTEEYDTKVKSLLADLKNNPDTLRAIFLDLQRQDPRKAESFATALISLDSDFRGIIPTIEAKSKLALGNDTLQGATITGKEITQTQDGYTTTAKLDGTDRTLGLSDSQFKLKSTLDSDKQAQAEADRIEKDLHDQLDPIGKKLQSLDAIKTHLETITNQNTDTNLADIKADIKSFNPELYTELGLENMTSLLEIQTAINTQITKLTNERDEIEKKAKNELDNLTQIHKQKLAERQEVQKIILEILHKIGFDRIPQAVINIIIAKVNENPAMFKFEKPIDFENGSIGFNRINDLSIQKFLKFSNGIMSGNTEFPCKYSNGRITFHESEEDAKANIPAPITFDIQYFVNRNLGMNPTQQALMNLEKSILKNN